MGEFLGLNADVWWISKHGGNIPNGKRAGRNNNYPPELQGGKKNVTLLIDNSTPVMGAQAGLLAAARVVLCVICPSAGCPGRPLSSFRKRPLSTVSLSESPLRLPFCRTVLEEVLLLYQRAEARVGREEPRESSEVRGSTGEERAD